MQRDLTEDGRDAIRPTNERLAKGGVRPAARARGEKAKPWNAQASLADVYLDAALISQRQWRAADSFTRVYYRAHGSPWRVATWTGPISGSGDDISETRISAQKQLDLIAQRLTQTLYAILRDVCGLHTPVTTWARNRGIHPAAGMPLLHQSLDLYAKHLGLPDDS